MTGVGGRGLPYVGFFLYYSFLVSRNSSVGWKIRMVVVGKFALVVRGFVWVLGDGFYL